MRALSKYSSRHMATDRPLHQLNSLDHILMDSSAGLFFKMLGNISVSEPQGSRLTEERGNAESEYLEERVQLDRLVCKSSVIFHPANLQNEHPSQNPLLSVAVCSRCKINSLPFARGQRSF